MNTQEKERLYIERFKSVYTDFPSGELSFGDKPDLIIRGEKKIGIEITEFFKKDGHDIASEQRQQVLRDKVIEDAKSTYFSKGKKSVDFHISFEVSCPIRDVKTLTNQVVEMAERLEGRETGRYKWQVCDHIPEINGVYLNNREYENPLWMDLTVHEVKVTEIARLNEIVAKKESSALQYEKCDEVWLLICVNAFNNAQEQEIRIDYSDVDLFIAFEKIILYKTNYDHIVEVPRQLR